MAIATVDHARPSAAVSYRVSDYVGLLRRHWWVVACALLLGAGGAGFIATQQQKVYQSTSSVLVTPTGVDGGSQAGGSGGSPINLDTEVQLVSSTEVASAAGLLLKTHDSVTALANAVTVSVPPNSTVLQIAYAANSPGAAQLGAHAFAVAYLNNRATAAQIQLIAQIKALDRRISQSQSALAAASSRIAGLSSSDPRQRALSSQIDNLRSQITTLTSRDDELSTLQITPGRIISDATLPTAPVAPSMPTYVASGALAGLLVGIGAAAVRHRMSRRVRRATELPRRAGMPLLAQLSATPRFDDVFPVYSAGGRMFNRLSNEVQASLRPDGKVIVVAGASKGSASTIVSANLAAAFGRAGHETILIGVHQPESAVGHASLTRLTGVAAAPGLAEVLAGQAQLDEALQPSPRNPWLRVITTGGTAGPLPSVGLRGLIDALDQAADVVVIEAPSTSNSAEAQSLAGLADIAIVAVEQRRTEYAQVRDAAEQLARVGTALLGAVVLPRLRISRKEPPAQLTPGHTPPAQEYADDLALPAQPSADDVADRAGQVAGESAPDYEADDEGSPALRPIRQAVPVSPEARPMAEAVSHRPSPWPTAPQAVLSPHEDEDSRDDDSLDGDEHAVPASRGAPEASGLPEPARPQGEALDPARDPEPAGSGASGHNAIDDTAAVPIVTASAAKPHDDRRAPERGRTTPEHGGRKPSAARGAKPDRAPATLYHRFDDMDQLATVGVHVEPGQPGTRPTATAHTWPYRPSPSEETVVLQHLGVGGLGGTDLESLGYDDDDLDTLDER